MAITRRIFVDTETGQLYRNFNDFAAAPQFIVTSGDEYNLEVVFVRTTGYAAFPMEVVKYDSTAYGSTKFTIGNGTTTALDATVSGDIQAPVLSIGSTVGSYFTFSIDQQAIYGSFKLTLTKSSPSLSVTTAPITYPFTASDIETAIKNAINGAAGWSAATCTVIPTGGLSGQIKVGATNSSTVYDLATASTTMTTSSSLYGFDGVKFSLFADPTDITTYLGAESEKAATLEIIVDDSGSAEAICVTQTPCIVRDTIA